MFLKILIIKITKTEEKKIPSCFYIDSDTYKGDTVTNSSLTVKG